MKIVIDIPQERYTNILRIAEVQLGLARFQTAEQIIAKGTPLPKFLDKITAEISDEYNNCNICEWFEDYDYEENDVSEYREVGRVSDIIDIIDKYKS